MADQLQETTHFGLTRVGSGETLAKNGYSFGDLDRVKLDRLLYAALTHTHSGGNAVGDPSEAPTFVVNPTGGHLPASTTFYYRVAYMDEFGLESASSPEGSVTTGDPIGPGPAPSGTPTGTGGTLAAGIYAYVYTYLDAYGGESTPSAINNVAVNQDTTGTTAATSKVDLGFGTMPSNALSINVYRSRPGQSGFYLIGTFTTGTTFTDTGLVEDQTISAPSVNTTMANNSIQIIAPLGFFPSGVHSWRIYRTTSSGAYDGNSLVKEVTEGATISTTTLTTTYTDLGDALEAGFPLNTSATVPPGQVLTLNHLQGTLPLDTTARGAQNLSFFVPGSPNDGGTVYVTETPGGMNPVRATAYFATPPSGTVTFHIEDSSSNGFDLDCGPGTHQSGDPSGYYHLEYPLVLNALFEAEGGTRSDPDNVAISNDPTASNTQAVELASSGDSVTVQLGVLDAGTYHMYCSLRVDTYDLGFSNDLTIAVVTSDGTVLASQNYTLNTLTQLLYFEVGHGTTGTGPLLTYTAPGGLDVSLLVYKNTSSAQVYEIDTVRFAADTVVLAPGLMTVTASVSGGAAGSDANVTIWF